jgi:hypothetical protein
MRISQPFDSRARRGYALMITLVFLAVTLVALSSLMWWASSNGKVTRQNQLFTTAESAADAATEVVVANLDFDWVYGQTLQSASHYANLTLPDQTAWPMKFQYSDGSGNNNKIGVTIALTNYYGSVGSEFAGLSGYKQPCTITSTATTTGQLYTVSATIQQVLNATIIPLFQFAIFYNMNLEIDPGAQMAVNGPVFSNQGIWAGTPNVNFISTVSSKDQVNVSGTDPWCGNKTDSGTPLGNFAIQPLSGRDSLNLPIGNSTNNSPSAVEAIINLPGPTNGAPNPWAYTTNGQTYLFNASDLIISNAYNGIPSTRGTNITIWYQDPGNSLSYLTEVTNDFYALKTGGSTNILSNTRGKNYSTNVLYATYSFVTNIQYYDFRESDTVQAVQIDVSLMNKWLTNTTVTGGNQYNRTSFSHNSHGIRSIYVFNNIPSIAQQLPAVRMINGDQLPFTRDPNGSGKTTAGLTVATPQPIYIKGDYNVQTASSAVAASALTTDTTYTYPAALLADAITILSDNWQDVGGAAAYQPGGSLGSRTKPTPTTVNAAALEGIVVSTNSNYSGGVENFLRMEEDWNNVILQYNGSIVVMFPSIYATSVWQQTGIYYNAPTRHWGFDYNFTDPNKLPPLTPKVFTMIRAPGMFIDPGDFVDGECPPARLPELFQSGRRQPRHQDADQGA